MNSVGLQKGCGQPLGRSMAYSKPRTGKTEYSSFWRKNGEIPEDKSLKSVNEPENVSSHATENDKAMLLFHQSETAAILSAGRIRQDFRALKETDEETDAQADMLRERYDIENLSMEEYYNLLEDLVNLRFISDDEFEKALARELPPEVAEGGGMLTAASPDSEEDRVRILYEEQIERYKRLTEIFEKILRKENETAVQKKRSYDGLDVLGPSAPDRVKEAWKKAEKESGTNGYGMNSEGMLTNITVLFAMSVESRLKAGKSDILGSTVDSAVTVVQKALERLGIPENDEEKKEKAFYEAFLRFLE